MNKELLDAVRILGGWNRVEEGKPLPDWVDDVILANCDKCHERKLTGRISTGVFHKPKNGWAPIIGWELWLPLP